MRNHKRQLSLMFIVQVSIVIILSSPSTAENWPSWRGPRGDGTIHDPVPTKWNGITGDNIRWKSAIPGSGHSSPIVWKDSIFVTACLDSSFERQLIRINRKDGLTIWQNTVLESRLESKHALNSFASGTPATDGEHVYVSFLEVGEEQVLAPNVGNERWIYPGKMVVAAYDFDGNQIWMKRVGPFVSAHGFCTNPVLYKDLVILNGDHDGDSYLIALNRRNGDTVWQQPRRHRTRSYCTPIIRTIEGQDQLVLSGSLCLAAFDPSNGSPLWNVEGPTEQFVASMVDDGNDFYAVGGFPTYHVMAVNPKGRGDVTDTHIRWHETNVRCYVPSPVVVQNFLVVADDRGTANCFDTQSGERYWQSRMGRHYSGSLVCNNTLAFLTDDDGVTKVIRVAKETEIVQENELGERIFSSPAASDGQLFLRGEKHLYCIGSTASESAK